MTLTSEEDGVQRRDVHRLIEKAIASGMRARATTIPASTSSFTHKVYNTIVL